MKKFLLILSLVLSNTLSLKAQEWSVGGEIGATLISFFDYTTIQNGNRSFDRGYAIPHNEGWTISYYTAKNHFFLIGYTSFFPKVTDVRIIDANYEATWQSKNSATFNHIISFDIGKQLSLFGSEKFFFEPLAGIGIEILERYNVHAGRVDFGGTSLLILESGTYKRGVNPSLQGGFRFSFRHRRSKFSLKALGNLGLYYHAEHNYRVILEEETFYTSTRSKSDFIAAQVSYEYIFKSDKIEPKKRKRKIIIDELD